MVMRNRAVFLDRDGVLNRAHVRGGKPYPPPSLADLEILPGVADACRAFRDAGLRAIVVTNQPDVATGKQERTVVDAIHARLMRELALDDIKACYCVEGDDCDCYKPKPGLLLEAAREWSIDLAQSFMVGDRWRDIAAGRAVGCRTYFIDYGYDERRPDRPHHTVADLAHAGRLILEHIGRSSPDRETS